MIYQTLIFEHDFSSPLVSTAMETTKETSESILEKMESISSNDFEYQHLLSVAHEKQRHQLQEVHLCMNNLSSKRNIMDSDRQITCCFARNSQF